MDARYIAEWLVSNGIEVRMSRYEGGFAYSPVDGFYKSDGMAFIVDSSEGPKLHARYGEITDIESPLSVVLESINWHERSKDKYFGWEEPPAAWKELYLALDQEKS